MISGTGRARLRSRAGGWFTAGIVICLLAALPAAAELSEAELRGKQIYFSGASPSGGPITAYFGETKQALPGQAATCGRCHTAAVEQFNKSGRGSGDFDDGE